MPSNRSDTSDSPAHETSAGRTSSKAMRIILLIVYLGSLLLYATYEWNAHKVLERADQLEGTGRYRTAAAAYEIVITNYPFSFATLAAESGLDRLGGVAPESATAVPVPTAVRPLMQSLGPHVTDLFPISGLSVASAILFMVAATRLHSRGWLAFVAGALCTITVYIALAVLVRRDEHIASWLASAAGVLRESPMSPFLATWMLLGIGSGLTLTHRYRETRALATRAVSGGCETPLGGSVLDFDSGSERHRMAAARTA